ncbi:MAG: hypothetical protein COW01_12420 [Bdellovibrionales bacterium CG12_big_fil_rev_8_21_14_0_65_38_15]|nr:MAG: hypothetical protein COW79_05605 [Bdellovibrionales bacterium CG22_combo_CG10-13_8_21_14_all_38_13]PIQ53949.1 MAG: hypothetical protein COW01_12420 [Bdellovibrionales bacterium CG12_big_fil_rev_8_21_14_0_65_38_15]PIR30989.1 MAG: hypothetical protein COV38_03000 [Bdellovibrionales bacterium CG11_big_fil_rev_8_21_14_0_20_38_13]
MTKLIKCFEDLKDLPQGTEVFCLNSGGLDSAYLICRLIHDFKFKVHTLTLDVGQNDQVSVCLPNYITKTIDVHTVDAKEEFARDCVLPLIRANGIYLNQHPLSASLSRPLIAKHLVRIAQKYKIETILHSATPSQNSMRRFNTSILDLGFNGLYGSPYLNDNISRIDKASYIRSLGATIEEKRSFSIDTNLFCREFESGDLDNPELMNLNEEMFLWTKSVPSENIKITLEIENGIPVRINNQSFSLVELVSYLNTHLGPFGLGRYLGLEEGPLGKKVIEARETPAGYFLLTAFDHLINASFDYKSLLVKRHLDQLWTCEAVEGRWFGTIKNSIDQFNNEFFKNVSGRLTFDISYKTMDCRSIISSTPRYSTEREFDDLNKEVERAA